jgi:hypothetical protein
MKNPVDELDRLSALIGNWRTTGKTIDGAVIDASDSYERLPGGALLHLVDALVGDQEVKGAEIIGYNPSLGHYETKFFGTGGPAAYEANLTEKKGTLVWSMLSARNRFTGNFSKDGNTITGHWEQKDEAGNWQPWMDVTLSK